MSKLTPLWYRKNGQPIYPIMGGDGTEPGEPAGDGSPGDGGEPPAPPTLALTPDQIRNSPEFRALEKQNRTLARQKGAAEVAAATARAQAEEARQAAEAQQQAALETQLRTELGEDGVAAWVEIAELSQTDQVAAARKFRELMAASAAQSGAGDGAAGDPGTPPAGEGNGNVPAQTPPPPSRGVDGGQPLGAAAAGEDVQQVIAGLERNFTEVVERNQSLATRNRVTMKDRAAAMISYLGASYLKALNPPRR